MGHTFRLPSATAKVCGGEEGWEGVGGRGRARREERGRGRRSKATLTLEMGLELLIPATGPFAIVSLRQ